MYQVFWGVFCCCKFHCLFFCIQQMNCVVKICSPFLVMIYLKKMQNKMNFIANFYFFIWWKGICVFHVCFMGYEIIRGQVQRKNMEQTNLKMHKSTKTCPYGVDFDWQWNLNLTEGDGSNTEYIHSYIIHQRSHSNR